jgi:hypothetical protein
MSSFWTPDGEHKVTPETGSADRSPVGDHETDGGYQGSAGSEIDAETQASVEAEMIAAQDQLLSVPARQIVANHAIGLFELAALHLRVEEPDLDEVRIAVDAMGLLVDNLGDRLPDRETLVTALQQLRMAYVEVKGSLTTPADDSNEEE